MALRWWWGTWWSD